MKLLAFLLFGAFTLNLSGQVSHKQWDQLVKKHVSEIGNVNYKGIIQDKEHLTSYLTLLSNNPPKSSWTKDETLAYWINAYNAITIDLILRNYPIKSIKYIDKPWEQRFWKLGNKWWCKKTTFFSRKCIKGSGPKSGVCTIPY